MKISNNINNENTMKKIITLIILILFSGCSGLYIKKDKGSQDKVPETEIEADLMNNDLESAQEKVEATIFSKKEYTVAYNFLLRNNQCKKGIYHYYPSHCREAIRIYHILKQYEPGSFSKEFYSFIEDEKKILDSNIKLKNKIAKEEEAKAANEVKKEEEKEKQKSPKELACQICNIKKDIEYYKKGLRGEYLENDEFATMDTSDRYETYRMSISSLEGDLQEAGKAYFEKTNKKFSLRKCKKLRCPKEKEESYITN